MRHPIHAAAAHLAIGVALLTFTGCGGGDSVVHIDGASDASISKATLNHWMQSMAGGDFRESIGAAGPRGLVSDPADYKRCTSASKLVAPRSFFNQLRLSAAQINQKCRELYRSIKAQALSFLISVQWAVAEGAEQGIEVTDADVRHAFERLRKVEYPTEQDLRKYLTERQWSLSDIFYQLKHHVLVTRLLTQLEKAGGGERVHVKLVLERYNSMIANTSCMPGYVVPNCNEYHGPPTVSPAPNAILKEMVGKAS